MVLSSGTGGNREQIKCKDNWEKTPISDPVQGVHSSSVRSLKWISQNYDIQRVLHFDLDLAIGKKNAA